MAFSEIKRDNQFSGIKEAECIYFIRYLSRKRALREKNASDGAPINAGYMVLEPEVFDMLEGGDSCVFEKTALVKLAQEGQLMSYIHTGFWQCMDNIREKSMLEKLLAEDKAPWKRWERSVPEIPDYAK